MLLDEDATRGNILNALIDLDTAVQTDQGDVAVIAFSGHAARARGETYLLPHEVNPRSPRHIAATGVSMTAFKAAIKTMGERGKVLVLLDACHSGDIIEGQKGGILPDVDTVRQELMSAGNGVIVLTSSSGSELSFERQEWGNGAFMKAVKDALRGAADADANGWVNVGELEQYVAKAVRDMTDGAQNPRVGSLTEGRFAIDLFAVGG